MSFSLDPGPDRRQWGDRATWLGHPYGRGRDSSECTLKLRHPRDVGQRSALYTAGEFGERYDAILGAALTARW